jgi:outer membrane protein OmpA-like peptidoglycan-associated protein
MKLSIPVICAALTGTSAIAHQSVSHADSARADERASSPVSEVFFAFDSARLHVAEGQLSPIVQWAQQHPSGRIVLDGSTDVIGPYAYNVRLSARRAEAVRDRLVAMGVDNDRIVLAIYGEDGLHRANLALDRRVTIWTTYEPLYAIVDTSLVRGKAVLWTQPVSLAELHPARSQVATR